MTERGIIAIGAYLPAGRLPRSKIGAANQWLHPSVSASATGERSVANWDEDVVTMGVAAARQVLGAECVEVPKRLWLASTTAPFADRQNAGLVAAAAGLPHAMTCIDAGASMRCGTTALATTLTAASDVELVAAADRRIGRPGSAIESEAGDGAAAVLVGTTNLLARHAAHQCRTHDFVDHFRSHTAEVDYEWEERWVRDAGLLKLIPEAVAEMLRAANCGPTDVAHIVVPVASQRLAAQVARACGMNADIAADVLVDICGHTGVAHPLLQLADVLAKTQAGDRIVIVGFGQGVDAILLEATGRSVTGPTALGVRPLAKETRREWHSYMAFLAHRGQLEPDWGMRSEADLRTSLPALWRNSEATSALQGGRCASCGTVQFPRTRICVNPECHAVDTQEAINLAGASGVVISFTVDHLAFSPAPPAIYGTIELANGARVFTEFTDCDAEEIAIGREMTLVFRVKDFDRRRGFRRYFWKATPRAHNA